MQETLFDTDIPLDWEQHWKYMPDFKQNDLTPFRQILVSFKNQEEVNEFAKMTGAKITKDTRSTWFIPEYYGSGDNWEKNYYTNEKPIQPKYPIYIISKGRWHNPLTAISLDKMNVDYKICVEPKEFENYKSVISEKKILCLPENFSELGSGSIPVRNFVWEHSIKNGAEKHWILDDNIHCFLRTTNNIRAIVYSGATFCAIEDFVDRYENIGIAGMNYYTFTHRRVKFAPYKLNTRIYSCILIDNKLNHRWRGKYNEDTDLSLRVLKDGLCTVLFNTFSCYKKSTMLMKGGNTDTIYNSGDNRREFAESLKKQHPDLVEVVYKFNRWHHNVNYKQFQKLKLKLKPNLNIPDKPNNYGMRFSVFS